MSANVPTDICFSFTGLMQRGGGTGPHRDGWGVAFYEDRGCRVFHDTVSGANSELARVLERQSIKSRNVICHVRKANRGRVALENTHPFQRELWGRAWTFAHNGQLRGIKAWPLGYYNKIGTTDSEHAFCWLLGALRERFPRPPRKPGVLWRFLESCLEQLDPLGTLNVMLSDGRVLYTYCNTRLYWLTRRAPFGHAHLSDAEMSVDFAEVTTPDDVVTVIASQPLTHNEHWTAVECHRLVAFRHGVPYKLRPGGGVREVQPG